MMFLSISLQKRRLICIIRPARTVSSYLQAVFSSWTIARICFLSTWDSLKVLSKSDAPDLSLNVSRELLQQDVLVKNIRKNVVKKVLEMLSKMDEEKYDSFYAEFGNSIKAGVAMDFETRISFPSLSDSRQQNLRARMSA